ncbi:MAG TPA: hypothetical protein VFS66_09700 [Acidimicrobiia bacterium]|nr:hypothetical protein [Acidimicrobiia bacterium]
MTSDKARPPVETSVVQIALRALLGTLIGTAAAWSSLPKRPRASWP